MTADVVVIAAPGQPGITLCFENKHAAFSDRLTIGQAKRLLKDLEHAVFLVDPNDIVPWPKNTGAKQAVLCPRHPPGDFDPMQPCENLPGCTRANVADSEVPK